jgi:predicted transcriptional regulator
MVRKEFVITLSDIVEKMDVSQSIMSDNEKERLFLGVAFIKKYILMIYELAQKNENMVGSIESDQVTSSTLTTIPILEFDEKKYCITSLLVA